MSKLQTGSAIESAFAPLRNTIDTLWSSIIPQGGLDGPTKIAFAGTAEGDGATTIATCAAIGLAKHIQARVLLVEANFAAPRLASQLQLHATPGFAGLLDGTTDVERAIQATDLEGLSAMPAGVESPVRPGIFSSDRARDVFRELGEQFDCVIVDAPPVLDHPESRSIFWHVDRAVLVLRAGSTKQDAADKAAQEIEHSGAELLGAVLNRRRSDLPSWLTGNQNG